LCRGSKPFFGTGSCSELGFGGNRDFTVRIDKALAKVRVGDGRIYYAVQVGREKWTEKAEVHNRECWACNQVGSDTGIDLPGSEFHKFISLPHEVLSDVHAKVARGDIAFRQIFVPELSA
jgi:hypothetical protein